MDHAYRFVLDRRGLIQYGEASFFQPDAGGREFKRDGDRILPRLQGWVAAFSNLLQVDGGVRVLLVPWREDEDHWVCRAVALAASDLPLIGLSIHAAGGSFQPRWADVSITFGLTQAEQEVLNALLCGRSPLDVSERWNVSINTIRTHVRHLHDKLNVRDQHELWRKMLGYRIS